MFARPVWIEILIMKQNVKSAADDQGIGLVRQGLTQGHVCSERIGEVIRGWCRRTEA